MTNKGSPPAASAARRRLERLHELVARRVHDEWGRSYVEEVLRQDPHAPEARCPRYAGVLQESGDECVILAESVQELTLEMQARADSEIPILPVEAVDLDTGERSAAYRETTVRFIGEHSARARVVPGGGASAPGGAEPTAGASTTSARRLVGVDPGQRDALDLAAETLEEHAAESAHSAAMIKAAARLDELLDAWALAPAASEDPGGPQRSTPPPHGEGELLIVVASEHPCAGDLTSKAAERLACELDAETRHAGSVTVSELAPGGPRDLAAWRFPAQSAEWPACPRPGGGQASR